MIYKKIVSYMPCGHVPYMSIVHNNVNDEGVRFVCRTMNTHGLRPPCKLGSVIEYMDENSERTWCCHCTCIDEVDYKMCKYYTGIL